MLAYIGLGSNLKGPKEQIENALRTLNEAKETTLLSFSSFYQSKSPKATGEFAPPHSLTLSEHRILIVIALIGLALRIVYLWGQSRNNPLFLLPKVDAFWHHEWAQQIASGAPEAIC